MHSNNKNNISKSKRLLKIKSEIDNNQNIDQVISSFKPPIFWKEKDIVKKQAQCWSTNEVKIIYKVNSLEVLIKKILQIQCFMFRIL